MLARIAKIATPKRYRIEDGVTQSMLTSFLACRQRMRYQLDGWETKRPKSYARYGSLVHAALEAYYKTIHKGIRPASEAARKAVKLTLLEGLAKSSGVEDAETMNLEALKAYALLDAYASVWKDDTKVDWVQVEHVFDVDFRGYRLRGKRDGVFRSKKNALYVFETKNRSRVDDEEVLSDKLSFDPQSLFYLVTLRLEMPKEAGRINGALYNILRNPSLQQKQGEDEKTFIGRIRSDVLKRPDHYFKRFELAFPKEVIETFEDELEAKLKDFSAWVAGEQKTYKNEGSCTSLGHCEFLSACATGTKIGFSKTRERFRELLEPKEATNAKRTS